MGEKRTVDKVGNRNRVRSDVGNKGEPHNTDHKVTCVQGFIVRKIQNYLTFSLVLISFSNSFGLLCNMTQLWEKKWKEHFKKTFSQRMDEQNKMCHSVLFCLASGHMVKNKMKSFHLRLKRIKTTTFCVILVYSGFLNTHYSLSQSIIFV